jgi:acetolactate decarboxylase
LYISAPINALLEGIYREDTTIEDILRRGDFGLGTFNDLDGEMLVLDGVVYQMRSDGRAYQVDKEVRTPFASVSFFSPDTSEGIEHPLSYQALQNLLDRMLPSPNMIYAIRMEGRFSYVRTRSVPKQDCYRPLVEVAREQPEFEYQDTDGVLVGFWTPDFMGALSVPGYHLHFLDADLASGGHLLECETERMTVSLQHLPRLEVGLPVTLDYLTADFTRNVSQDLEEAEK